MSSILIRAACIASAALLGGCFGRPAPAAPPAHPPTPASAATLTPAAGSAEGASARRNTGLGPRVEVDDVDGVDLSAASAAILPAAGSMKECRAGSGGAMRIRIKSDKGATSMHVEHSTSMDGAARRCVLEALSTVDIDDVASHGSPSSKPSGFSSLVTVAW
jgi:hypothetical protein